MNLRSRSKGRPRPKVQARGSAASSYRDDSSPDIISVPSSKAQFLDFCWVSPVFYTTNSFSTCPCNTQLKNMPIEFRNQGEKQNILFVKHLILELLHIVWSRQHSTMPSAQKGKKPMGFLQQCTCHSWSVSTSSRDIGTLSLHFC